VRVSCARSTSSGPENVARHIDRAQSRDSIAARNSSTDSSSGQNAETTLAIFIVGLVPFVASVGLAISALMPREYLTLGMAYIRRLPTWSEILKQPEQVRGDAMRGLVEAIAVERNTNRAKVRSIRWSLRLLFAGLVLITVEAATLGVNEVTS